MSKQEGNTMATTNATINVMETDTMKRVLAALAEAIEALEFIAEIPDDERIGAAKECAEGALESVNETIGRKA